MASFMDSIFKKVTDASKDISDGLQKGAEAAKLQAKINTKNAECGEIYQKMGELYYKSRLNNTQLGTEMTILWDQADEVNKEIRELQENLDKVRNISRCASCGKVIEANSVFCKHCGAKQPEPVEEEEVYEAPAAEDVIYAEPVSEEPETEEAPIEEAPAAAETPVEDDIKAKVEQEMAFADAPAPEDEPAKEEIETYVEPEDK